MSKSDVTSVPRAMIHKRILSTAEEEPEAAMEEIANRVSGATIDIVERVLEEYGDPSAGPDEPTEEDTMEDPTPTAVEELTDKQRQTLEAINERPEASQRELAAELDVTCATVNKRVNAIPGFDWADREEFVSELLDREDERVPDDASVSTDGHGNGTGVVTNGHGDGEPSAHPMAVSTPGTNVQGATDGTGSHFLFDDPDLNSRVIHACMTYDGISRDEEIRILQAVMGANDAGISPNGITD